MEVPALHGVHLVDDGQVAVHELGAGSEGAWTKGPFFYALPAILDLNANLLSYVLTGHDGWLSAAGYVGPQVKVDHDFSLPEIFARMTPQERGIRRKPVSPGRPGEDRRHRARGSGCPPAGLATG